MVAYLQWLESFDMENDEIKADISEVMVECPEVRALYSKLVPDAVSHADFWQRYYYRYCRYSLILTALILIICPYFDRFWISEKSK